MPLSIDSKNSKSMRCTSGGKGWNVCVFENAARADALIGQIILVCSPSLDKLRE